MFLQILANPSHHFIDSSLYKDVILVAWDPAPYSANLNLVSIFLMPRNVAVRQCPMSYPEAQVSNGR